MSLMTGVAWTVATGMGLYGLLVSGLHLGQRRLLYRPNPEPPRLSAPYESIGTRTADGVTLRHALASADSADFGVLACHGNAGHLGHRLDKFAPLHAAGWNVAVVGYRGFGGNPGQPSEAGLIADAESVLERLAVLGIPPERVVLYGESLGTGVATALAARRPVAGLVLEGGFTAIADVAQRHYWYVPARRLVRDRFESRARIRTVTAPLLMLHGTADSVVPPDLGERLFAAANAPKTWHSVRGAGHTGVWDQGGREATLRFLARVAGGNASRAAQPALERV
ncbi:hypothetical protein SAMN05216241_102308 [Limimonas halophila]|uniref:Serine aminopeptidase S33 domain-containing protein n=1 Tax=Limimonas halophila TaxID=1082479 RepID=A0A1G7NTV8_9PROT|nr:alpha/beta hydrolase [Limimonas halophila]SDF77495.1 hypothetical protein SAMN05216241_102308 [Limimonas halophila]